MKNRSRKSLVPGLLALALLVGCASRGPKPDTGGDVETRPDGVGTVGLGDVAVDRPAPAEAPATEAAVLAYRSAQGHFDGGRWAAAVADAERATGLDGETAEYQLMLGRALSERIHQLPVFNKLPMARRIEAAFLRAVELDPESVEGHIALARYYSEAPPVAGGDRAKAESHARRLLELDPTEGHTMLAKLFDLWHRPEEAAKHRALATEAAEGSKD